MPPLPSRAHSFDVAADRYAAHRPSYPPAVLDAVEAFAARPLTRVRAADIGAGTGIATALLRARGAEVIAVEPGAGMAAQFRRTHPGIPLVRGDGNALPLADASLDLVTYAQSWHWTDLGLAAPEALRVLRPGGVLALWWNLADVGVDWIAAQVARLQAHHAATGTTGAAATASTFSPELPPAPRFGRRLLRWFRDLSLDAHLANLATHSAFLIRPAEETRAFLATERAELLRTFPDGLIRERYVVDLRLAVR